jgi:hypothetical protein
MELMDDKIGEGGRPPSAVVPRVAVRGADQTVAIGKRGHRPQLAGVGIPLGPLAAIADHPEAIRRSVQDAADEAGPGAVAEGHQSVFVPGTKSRLPGGRHLIGEHVDRACPRRPDPEGRAVGSQRGPHRRGLVNVLLSNRHVGPKVAGGSVVAAEHEELDVLVQRVEKRVHLSALDQCEIARPHGAYLEGAVPPIVLGPVAGDHEGLP